MTHFARHWFGGLALTLSLAAAVPAASHADPAAGLTAREAAQVKAMADGAEQQCTVQAAAQLTQQAAMAESATPNWVSHLTAGNYCKCLGRRIQAGSTPALVRTGTQADGQALVKNSANGCAVEGLKATFPEVCRAWSKTLPTEQQTQACRCVQARVDQVTADTLAETVKQTVGDYVRWQKNPADPFDAGPASLLGTFRTCVGQAAATRP
jgi:hypothetical protein